MPVGRDSQAPQAIPAIPSPAPLSQTALQPSALTATPELESSEIAAAAPAIEAARPAPPPPHSYAAAIAGPRATQFAEVTELALRIQTLEKRQRWYTVAMALIVLVAIAWPVVFSALAVLNAPDEPLPHPSSSSSSGTTANKDTPVQEAAAVHAASVETDPEARP